jgi:hypothetical protein
MQFLASGNHGQKVTQVDAKSNFNFDLDRMRAAVGGSTIRIPAGLSRQERRKWIFENAGKCSD